jgi:hypothetical protein
MRNPAYLDRTKRLMDHDGDPNTARLVADGSASRPYYRQGRTLWAPSSYLDLFHKPYRGDLTTIFMGTEDGPDLLLEDKPNVIDLLDVMNNMIFTNQEQTGRISRIAIYAPPMVMFDGQLKPAGICTVKVTVAKYRRLQKVGIIPLVMNHSLKLGEVSARMVLGEVPGIAANGPLESCGPITVGGGLKARWGRVIAAGDVNLASDLDGKVRSAFPYKNFSRRISGNVPGDDYYDWVNDPASVVEDPWLKILTAGDLAGHSALADQPYPHDQNTPIDLDHSNLFQRVAGTDCGRMRYETMKAAAASGEQDARYFTYDPVSGLFKEWGGGPAKSLRDWTHSQEGLFFFDTRDGMPPNGFPPGDPKTNLTPPVTIQSTDWNFSGLLYVNAESIAIRNVTGANRVIIPPGEPFDDVNGNGEYDTGETFVNLSYPTTIIQGSPGSDILKDNAAVQSATATSPDLETYSFTTTTGRDPQGIPITGQVNLFGVLYNAGNIVAEGPARHYGSLIAGTAVVQTTPGADTPEIFFDERLNTGVWPPAEISFPRTHVSLWVGPS